MRDDYANSNRASARGFTLIEVTIAVLMMGIVAAACFTSLSVAYRARRQIEDLTEPTRGAQLAIKRLERDITSILPPRGTLAGPLIGESETDGDRETDVVTFHALTAQGVRRIEWTIELSDDPLEDEASNTHDDGERAWVLVRREWSNLLAAVEDDPNTQIIARGVSALEITYFDGADWLDEWDSTLTDNQLPQSIRITLTTQTPRAAEATLTEAERQDRLVSRAFVVPCAEPPAGGRASG